MRKKFALAALSLGLILAAASPQPTFAACLMDGSTCVEPAECCSNRCMAADPDSEYGICDPLPSQT